MNVKEGKKRVKAYFLIINIVLATVAFAYLIGSVELVSAFGEATIPIGGIKATGVADGAAASGGTGVTTVTPSGGGSLFDDLFKNFPGSTDASEQIANVLGVGKNPTNLQTPAGDAGGAGKLAADATAKKATEEAAKTGITAFTPGSSFGLPTGATAQSLSGITDLAGKTVTLNGVTGAKTLSNGNVALTHLGGTTEVSAQVGSDAISKAGLQSSDLLAKNAPPKGPLSGLNNIFTSVLIQDLMSAVMIGGLFALAGSFLGGNGAEAGFIAGFAGSMASSIVAHSSSYGGVGKMVGGFADKLGLGPMPFGVIVGAIIFVVMYKKEKQEVVEFNCNPWEAPIGGADCELCNDNEFVECSEYRCKSLGQACELIPENVGKGEEACVWKNPYDVNSPMIKIGSVLEGYKWKPDAAVRPPATGAVIEKQSGGCIEAFTALEFDLVTDEPSQCKIDYNLTKGDAKAKISAYDQMNYYVGGTNMYSYNHTEKMSLPGPAALNAIDPELKNDGTYTLYVRCRDANGNFNQDAFSVRFCVNPGPDTTPPKIEAVSIPSNSPIQFNKSSIDIEVYVNEPATCKWSRENRDYDTLENNMSCSTNIWEMNNNNVYTCKTTLTGVKDRQENNFYFRCKDKPGSPESDRNVNTQGYKYVLSGTQPLNIMKVEPNETIRGSTDTIPVYLKVTTDNGYKDGEANCYYSTTKEEKDYIMFLDTGKNTHEQRQDLTSGEYTYYIKCVDMGGNTAYNRTKFKVDVDRGAPTIVRLYKEGPDLKIITNEKSVCSYSFADCNFNIADGIAMPYDNEKIHGAEWKINQKYYIRCKDEYDNQPSPNTCSVVVRPYELLEPEGDVIEL